MTDPFDPLRQVVEATDADFSVRVASFDDLVRLQREAEDHKLTGRWSSDDAMREQVQPGAEVYLAPLLRNGRGAGRPDSYRCHIWFLQRSPEWPAPTLSLFDVTATSLSALREVSSPDRLRRLLRSVLESLDLQAIR